MTDLPKCDILALFPKRDELRCAAAVFEFDEEKPDGLIDGEYEHWTLGIAGMRLQIMLAQSQGNTKVALATRAALNVCDPAVALCVGTAAGREGEIAYMDVVLAMAVLGAMEWRMKSGKMLPQWDDKWTVTDDVEHDVDRFVKATDWHRDAAALLEAGLQRLGLDPQVVGTPGWPRVRDAWTVTSPFLHEDRDFLDAIWGLHARLRAVDMETDGFVQACASRARPRPWFVIRAVSDYGTKESKREDARPAAGVAAAVIAHALIERGLQRAHPLRLNPVQAPEAVLSESNFFARMTMPQFLATHIPRRFGLPFEEGVVSSNITITDLAMLCGGTHAERALDDLRELYFTTKYLDYDDEADVRRLTGSAWVDEVKDIYRHLGISLSEADILYVGVGTGRDLPDVCPEFKTLRGVDLRSRCFNAPT